ncbi:DNA-binding response regulator [Enterococcus dongliensis]|uniref:DNA-binding response regulator n=1 Tax=Enterococcus dongliensis TaxID=2559925 RepID=UPI00288E0132|nr:DNA-binding response regulator [Enterococcus dongliensis]MDT2670008.1 DNA-binding response regulator [Enterococcus dongliensis]
MKTTYSGVTSYVQGGQTKYRVELHVNDHHYQKRGFISFDEAVAYRKSLEEKYLPEKEIIVESDDVVKTYLKTQSIRKTSLQHNMSRVKVRKILINEGVYSTAESIRVNNLLSEGLSPAEVANKMAISISSVNNLSIYRKGEGKRKNPSKAAAYVRDFRERNKNKAPYN